ncbi:MAG TPA: TIGR04552 family protein, partial [Holophaga sp.]|nr:TIGR04552 family protein [Holophaga sp.]
MPIKLPEPMLTHPLFPLPPEITRVVLGGGSFIDQPGIHLPTLPQARDFALYYGYDVEIPTQREHLVKVFEDALAFMEEVVLDGTGLTLPPDFCALQDPLELLVWASVRPMDTRARWSCALLRVMHTLFHLDNNVYLRFLPEIQQQIFDRYERYLVPTADGGWVLKGAYEVPLLAVKRKESKNRVSMLLKLLHKPENVAETIYDQIGLRLVAQDLLGVLAAIRFLLDHHVLMATHIKPSRTRNLMVDIPALEAWMSRLPRGFTLDQLDPVDREALVADLAFTPQRVES